jgi:hypothetical protein
VVDGDGSADQRLQNSRCLPTRQQVELPVFQITNPRRETETEQSAQAKNMVTRATGIRIVLLDGKAKRAIDDVGRLAGGRGDHLGVVRAVLVGDMGVEGDARLVAVMGVHIADGFAAAVGAVELPVGG